jgi:hypothetical protein
MSLLCTVLIVLPFISPQILSIFKTPEERKFVFSASRHSASPGTASSCPNTNQTLTSSTPGGHTVTFCDTGTSSPREKKAKLCAPPVPFCGRNIHATMDVPGMFASSSKSAATSINDESTSSSKHPVAPVKQEEHQENTITSFSPTRSILRGKTFSAFAKKKLMKQHQSPASCSNANTDKSGEHDNGNTGHQQLSPMSSPDISLSKMRAFAKPIIGGTDESNLEGSPSNKKATASNRAVKPQQFRPASPTFSFASHHSLFTTYHV